MPTRSISLACALLAATLLSAQVAGAGVQKKSSFRGLPGPVGIAVDAGGVVHVSWQSVDSHLRYARIEGAKRREELVDANDSGSWSSIALDSAGRPHIAYHAELGGADGAVLMYAHFDGAAWSIENLGPGGFATAIAVDVDDQPHIVHATALGAFEYLHRDSGGWERESPTTVHAWSTTPMSLAIDAAGHAHVGLEDRDTHHPLYATNASGDWVPTELADAPGRGASVALDSLGLPHAAVPVSDSGTVLYSHFDGATWSPESLYDPNALPAGVTNSPAGAALVLGAHDQPQIAFTTLVHDHGKDSEIVVYAYFDGVEWRAGGVETRGASDFVRLAAGDDGAVHGVETLARPKETQAARYFRVALPDLTADWKSLTATEANGKTHVDGVLEVRNEGADTSKAARIALYLSADAVLDSGDPWILLPTTVGPVKVGRTRTVRFSFTRPGVWSGKYLIAVVDPARLVDDVDRSDNATAGLLP